MIVYNLIMMKVKYIQRLLIIISAFSLCACSLLEKENQNMNVENLEYCYIEESGTMASSIAYEIKKTENGATLSFYSGNWLYDDVLELEDCLAKRIDGDQHFYNELVQIFNENQIMSWDGFDKTNPNVLDGYSFNMRAVIDDDKEITAHGNNSYPETYQTFISALHTYLYP